MKIIYISQLEQHKQDKIKQELISVFEEELELTEEEIINELEIAMSSKLSDLADTIDIKLYLD